MSGWQPIETAPEDTPILVWASHLRWRGSEGIAFGYVHANFNGHKRVVTLDGPCGPTGMKPTHWHLVPAPPVIGN